MLRLAPGSAATSGKRSLVLRSCNDAPLGKVIAAVGLPLASTVGAVIVAGAVCAGSLSAPTQKMRIALMRVRHDFAVFVIKFVLVGGNCPPCGAGFTRVLKSAPMKQFGYSLKHFGYRIRRAAVAAVYDR